MGTLSIQAIDTDAKLSLEDYRKILRNIYRPRVRRRGISKREFFCCWCKIIPLWQNLYLIENNRRCVRGGFSLNNRCEPTIFYWKRIAHCFIELIYQYKIVIKFYSLRHLDIVAKLWFNIRHAFPNAANFLTEKGCLISKFNNAWIIRLIRTIYYCIWNRRTSSPSFTAQCHLGRYE